MMMTPEQHDLNQRFVYAPDKMRDQWQIMTGPGFVVGDCEDYALTLIWMLEGQSKWRFWWSLITFKYLLWHCTLPHGEGHVVMWWRGQGWTDNILKRVVRDRPSGYRLRIPYIAPTVALKMAMRARR